LRLLVYLRFLLLLLEVVAVAAYSPPVKVAQGAAAAL
jgi:hypothetical protein